MTWAELLGRDLLGAPAQPVGDVRPLEAQLLAVAIHAPDHDMGVRVIGVVVVDGGPFDLASEVLLDARHVAADVLGEVELLGVLG